jgi:hypothetical protein
VARGGTLVLIREERIMNVVDGILVTGAAATGVVVAERVRHRGSGSQVRDDVTQIGTSVTDHVGDATRYVGRTSGRALARSGEMADSLGRVTARAIIRTGHALAGGTGAVVGAYAGLIDRAVPWGHQDGHDRPDRRPATRQGRAARTASTSRRSASTRATSRTRPAAPKARRAS